jgi:hypothetical protein
MVERLLQVGRHLLVSIFDIVPQQLDVGGNLLRMPHMFGH